MRLLDIVLAQQNQPARPVLQHVSFAGFPIAIEYPKGTTRELKNDEGKTVYKRHMFSDYGYIENTQGRDGDEVDVVLGPDEKAPEVYVAHMIDLGPDVDQREDEDKVLLGFPSYGAAKNAFLLMYPKTFFGGMSVMPMADFKKRLAVASRSKSKIHCVSR